MSREPVECQVEAAREPGLAEWVEPKEAAGCGRQVAAGQVTGAFTDPGPQGL